MTHLYVLHDLSICGGLQGLCGTGDGAGGGQDPFIHDSLIRVTCDMTL